MIPSEEKRGSEPPAGGAAPTWAPKRIYLQPDDDDTDEDVSRPTGREDMDGASWCEDRVNDFDVEYIRADLAPALEARPAPAAPAAVPDPLELLRKVFAHRLKDPTAGDVSDVICRESNHLYWTVAALLGSKPAAPRESAPSSLPLDLEAHLLALENLAGRLESEGLKYWQGELWSIVSSYRRRLRGQEAA